MFESFLGIFGIGQSTLHRAQDRRQRAAQLLASMNREYTKAGITLDTELPRLIALVEQHGGTPEIVLEELLYFSEEQKRVVQVTSNNQDLVSKRGATPRQLVEFERWAGDAPNFPLQITSLVAQADAHIHASISQENPSF